MAQPRPGAVQTGTTEATRDRLINVAMQLFRQRGYDGTSLAAVAEQLKISAPAVYYHFSSKDELLFEAQKTITLRMLDVLQRNTARGTASERLRAFARTHVRAQLEFMAAGSERGVFTLVQMIRSLHGTQREQIEQVARRVLDLLREIIRQGVADGSFLPVDPTIAAFAIIGMNHHLFGWFNPDGELNVDEVAELHADFALRLVAADQAILSTLAPSRSRRESPDTQSRPAPG